jgi:hypothetical protein
MLQCNVDCTHPIFRIPCPPFLALPLEPVYCQSVRQTKSVSLCNHVNEITRLDIFLVGVQTKPGLRSRWFSVRNPTRPDHEEPVFGIRYSPPPSVYNSRYVSFIKITRQSVPISAGGIDLFCSDTTQRWDSVKEELIGIHTTY